MATLIMIWLFCGAIAAAIAHGKNRSPATGFLWGALLGVIGIIVVCCQKADPQQPSFPTPGWYPDSVGGHRYWNGQAWIDPPPEPQRLI